VSETEQVDVRVDTSVIAFYGEVAAKAGVTREQAMAVILAIHTMQEISDGA
jgi:hypothetical protein